MSHLDSVRGKIGPFVDHEYKTTAAVRGVGWGGEGRIVEKARLTFAE